MPMPTRDPYAWRKRHPEAYKAAMKRNRDQNPEKVLARRLVNRARRSGALPPGPCELGGDDCRGRIEAHHEDYGKPLEVRWLCKRHHAELHKQERAA